MSLGRKEIQNPSLLFVLNPIHSRTRKMTNGTAAGVDAIYTEYLKYSCPNG